MISTIYKRLLFSILLFLPLTLQAETIRIGVAANFTDAIRKIVSRFEKESGHEVKVSYGSTGKLYVQIKHGAPFDLFLAADRDRPLKALKKGYGMAGSEFIYARGRLALWSLKPELFNDGESYLQKNAFRRIAIANPKTAPYGVAAQELLQHLGIWSNLQKKIIRGDSIAQTFQFVATSNTDIGLIATSQLQSWQGEKGSLWEIPESYHTPIEQMAILLKRGASKPAARAFMQHLQSDSARKIIMEYGYGV